MFNFIHAESNLHTNFYYLHIKKVTRQFHAKN